MLYPIELRAQSNIFKGFAFGTPPKGVLEQRSFLIKIPLRGIGGIAPNLNFELEDNHATRKVSPLSSLRMAGLEPATFCTQSK